MKNNYLFSYLGKGRKVVTFLFLTLLILGSFDSRSQVVTQSESAESNFFPMPGWKTRKGVVAEFSRVAAASTVAPTVPALASGTYSTGGAAAAVTGGGSNVVMLNSFVSSIDTALLISKPFDFSNNAGVNPTFSFWVYRDAGYPGVNDRLEVFWSGVSPGLSPGYQVIGAVGNGTTITYTTSVQHPFTVGQTIAISGGLLPANYNVNFATITAVSTPVGGPYTFTINGSTTGVSSGSSVASITTLVPINHQGGSNVIPRLTTSFPTAINGAGWYEFKFTLPAATYNTKRNYFVIKGIAALGNNMYLDNFTVNTYPTAMLANDVQFDAVQQNGATTSQGATNQWIIGVRCVVGGNSGCGALSSAGVNNPVKLDSLLFNTNGCSNISTDILNAKVFYTGGYDQFNLSYISPFPAATGIPGASYPKPIYGNTLTGGQIATNLDFTNTASNCFYLEYDTTYFWLVYDMKAGAVGSNYVDGDFRGAVVGGGAGSCPTSGTDASTCTQAVTTTYTLVGACQVDIPYCVPTYSLGTSWANYTNNDYIHSVSLIGYGGTAINATTNAVPLQLNTLPCYPSCRFVKHPPDYEYRSPTVPGNTVTLQQGVTYSITVQVGTYFSGNNISAWIDFNRDGVFTNSPPSALAPFYPQMSWAGAPGTSAYTGEQLGYATLTALGTATWTFTVPSTGAVPAPFQGSTRLRVREWFAASPTAMHPCNPGTWGECEDFIVTIIPNCSASYKLWLGNTNDWNNPANWCPSVPTITDSTVINRALALGAGTRPYFYPVIKSGVLASCKSLTISNQDSLYIDAPNPGSTALKIAGNLNNNGYMNVVGSYNPTNNAVFPNSTGTLLNYLMTPLCGKTYKAAQTQIIYLASDLALLGMQAGDKITAIQLNVKNNDGTILTRTYNNFAIGYVNSAVTSFASTVPIPGVTTVYTNAAQPIVFGVNTFTLGTPITWDGASNIVIQYTFTNPSSSGTGSLNNDFIDITQSTGRNSTLILGRLLSSVQTVPAAGSFVGQVTGDITGNGAPVANTLNTASALMSLRPNATFIWDRPYGKPKVVVQGNFTNNGPFNAGKSLFVMDDTLSVQSIAGTRAVPFYTFSMAKSAANKAIFLNNDSISIQDTFFLGTGQMVMNGKPLFMKWSNPAAFSRVIQGTGQPGTAGTGLLISENANSIVNWTIGDFSLSPTAVTRTIPFGTQYSSALTPVQNYIPYSFIHRSGNLGDFRVGTKYWLNNTLPDPPTVTHIDFFNSTTPNPGTAADRYWMVGKTAATPTYVITSAVANGTSITFNTSSTTGLYLNGYISVVGLDTARFNISGNISAITPNSFTILNSAAAGSSGGTAATAYFSPLVDLCFRFNNPTSVATLGPTERPASMQPNVIAPGRAQPWKVFGLSWLRITATSVGQATVTIASGNGSVITYTTSLAHGFLVGQAVTISGPLTPAGYNIINGIITSVTANTFTVAGVQTGVSSGNSTAVVGPWPGQGGSSTPYNQQQTRINYVQAYGQNITTTKIDSVIVNGWDWPIVPATLGPYYTPSGPVGDFTPWTISVANSPLPIELVNFKARPDGKRVRLDWTTASEVDNDYFTVERTTDLNEYSFIDKVSSYMHNSNILLNYTTYDEQPVYGLQYYRLKQTDFNGAFSYSEPQPVWFGSKAPFEITNIYSDISVSNDITVDFMYNSEMPVNVEISDVSGRLIYSESGVAATNGSNKIKLNASLPHGLYFIIIRNDSDAVSRKFVY